MQVLSKKDQEQFWGLGDDTYNFVTVDQFCERFKTCYVGQNLAMELLEPKAKEHSSALSFSIYSLSKWKLLKVCFARELLLMKRNAFIYKSKSLQVNIWKYIAFHVSNSYFEL